VRIEQQPAFVLHQRNYSETSLLVELLTPEHGRLTVLAKGARRGSSPFRGILKPFQPLLVGWVGRTDLPILTHAEVNGGPCTPVDAGIYCGFYLNELLCRLLHRHDPHPVLFSRYARTLDSITRSPIQEEALRVFELHLLQELGYGPVLDREALGAQAIRTDALYDFVPDRGAYPVTRANEQDRSRGLRIHGETLLALARERFDSDVSRREAKRLMRTLLAPHLGLEPLHSRRLMQQALVARERARQQPAIPEAVFVNITSDETVNDD